MPHTCPECGRWCGCEITACTHCQWTSRYPVPPDEEDEPDDPEIPYDRPRFDNANRLVAPLDREDSPLWPSEGREPLGAQLALVKATNLGELNRAALDIAVSRTADSADGGVVLVRVPPEWMTRSSDRCMP